MFKKRILKYFSDKKVLVITFIDDEKEDWIKICRKKVKERDYAVTTQEEIKLR